METLVRMRCAVKDIRPSTYVRVYLVRRSVKAIVPNVDKLSYNTIANKLLPTLAFDATTLTGEIRKEWLTFVRTTCERQLSDSPMTMDEIDASYKSTKEEIELTGNGIPSFRPNNSLKTRRRQRTRKSSPNVKLHSHAS